MTYYEGLGENDGKYVKDEDALLYAMEQCGFKREVGITNDLPAVYGFTIEFEEQIREWYFSNWLKKEDEPPKYIRWN